MLGKAARNTQFRRSSFLSYKLYFKRFLGGVSGATERRYEGKTVFYSLADDHVRTIIDQGNEHIHE